LYQTYTWILVARNILNRLLEPSVLENCNK
jgi:hypothetical protein